MVYKPTYGLLCISQNGLTKRFRGRSNKEGEYSFLTYNFCLFIAFYTELIQYAKSSALNIRRTPIKKIRTVSLPITFPYLLHYIPSLYNMPHLLHLIYVETPIFQTIKQVALFFGPAEALSFSLSPTEI